MGKALYRRYRSTSFTDVVGQEHITDTLQSALEKGSVSHAYLFTGPRGTGKTSVARILAYAVNDVEYSDQTHLDIIEIDAASNRRIDEIRDLRDKVHIAPTTAQYKVYIVDEVHMLTREAFNALLKTLEEPPEHAIFILATTELHKVPDTIVSRTQRYTFKPISKSRVVGHLASIAKKEKLSIAPEALEALADHGRGSFRDSISMLDQLSGMQRDTYTIDDVRLLLGLPSDAVVHALVDSIAQNDTAGVFENVQLLKDQGTDSSRAARALSEYIRNSLVDGSSNLQQHAALSLLKELLQLTNHAAGYTAIEVAALGVMDAAAKPSAQSTTTTATTATSVAPSPPSKPTTKAPKEPTPPAPIAKEEEEEEVTTDDAPPKETVEHINSEDESTVPAATTTATDTEKWQQLVNDVKTKHNTLYGVLRMAEMSRQDDTIVLLFTFGFHKNRVESDANKKLFASFMKKHFPDTSYTLKVTPKEKRTPATTDASNSPQPTQAPSPPDEKGSKNDSPEELSNISNIFGDAELLDS